MNTPSNEHLVDPQVALDYDTERKGTYLSNQLLAYYTCLRRSISWYRKLAFELIFGTSIVNTYLIYKEDSPKDNITIQQFPESFVGSLFLVVPSENLKPCPTQQSRSQIRD